MTGSISCYTEGVVLPLPAPDDSRRWVQRVVAGAGYALASLRYIFVTDEYLLALNREVLKHDFYTDIITFPYHTSGQPIVADLYISVDRVADNANAFGVDFDEELHRVMIHGVLHMMGHNDETDEDEAAMRAAEDAALALRKHL